MCTKGKDLSLQVVKTLLKDCRSTVNISLLGNATVNKNLVVLENHNVIMRQDHKLMRGKVKIIAGGGAGTEPADSYYVGKGMLTAAVVGEIFTAPSACEILVAIRELSFEHSAGILLLVKNYIGDKLNFGLALEKALNENINVKMLVIGDNITESSSGKHGRKGAAGCVLVYKIAGEMAEQGKTLDEIINECKENILTGLATASVTLVPYGGILCNPLLQYLGSDEMVLGMGIYGQCGAKKVKINSLANTVTLALKEISLNFKSDFELNQSHVVMVNNLGATSKFEEAVLVSEISKQLKELGIKISQLYAGTFMSSLDTQGFSITVLKVNSPDTLKYLNALTLAPAWPRLDTEYDYSNESLSPTSVPNLNHDQLNKKLLEGISFGPILSEKATSALEQIVVFAAEALISCERQLNIIDKEVGDGDAGTVLKRGAQALKNSILNNEMDLSSPCKFLFQLAEICCKYMGGLSGALYYVFFNSAAKTFQNAKDISPDLCCTAFRSAVRALENYGKAELRDRTILDALCPAVDSFESAIKNGKSLGQALYLSTTTCEFKAEETKFIKPSWLMEMNINKPLLYADAGAHGATIWLRAVSEAFNKEETVPKPGIFLWKFLDEEESNYVLREISSEELLSFFEKKLKTDQTLLVTLFYQTLVHSRNEYGQKSKPTSALLSTIYYTHRYFIASKWRTPAETYFYFKESILCQSVESPPISIEIFKPEEAKNALLLFTETYLRNLPLIRVLHLPHYKLQFNLKFKGKKEEFMWNTKATIDLERK